MGFNLERIPARFDRSGSTLSPYLSSTVRIKTATLLAPEAASHHPQKSFEQRLTRRLIDLFTSRYMRAKFHHTFHFSSSSHTCQDQMIMSYDVICNISCSVVYLYYISLYIS